MRSSANDIADASATQTVAGHAETALRDYFAARQDVRLAFLFGSRVTQRANDESDVDVGVVLDDPGTEDRIWREMTALLGQDVDVVPLDRAPATLVSAVFRTGVPLLIRDRGLYRRLYLDATREAEDFAAFLGDYHRIAARSASLAPEDRARLIQRMEFMDQEWGDLQGFAGVTIEEYRTQRDRRRSIERCAENVVNALIDLAKIALASEKKPAPRTYYDALHDFGVLAGLAEEQADRLASCGRLRNMLAHEYLETLHARILQLIGDLPPLYDAVRQYLDQRISEVDEEEEDEPTDSGPAVERNIDGDMP